MTFQNLTALLLGALLAPAALAATPSSIANQLPELGTPADAALTRSDEYQIGRMIVRGMRDQQEILEDAEVDDYLQQLGSRLAAQTGSNDARYDYFAVRDDVINAFALPGGFIGVNTGLVLLTTNESELASVLAHETAHVHQRHIARAVQNQSRVSLTSTAAMLAAILVGAAAGAKGDAVGGALAVGQGLALQQTMNFTRAEEAEADRVGIGFLAGAGFDVTAMPAFFEDMSRHEGLSDAGPLEMLRSHPVTSERIAETRARAAQLVGGKVHESSAYPWMRERIRVLSADSAQAALVWYAKLRDQRALSDPERYGEALAQLRAKQPAVAIDALQDLLAHRPDMPTLYSTLGQSLSDAGQFNLAQDYFQRGLKLFPRNVPLTVDYAQALMQAGKPGPAHTLLLDLFNNVEPTPAQIRLTALAASGAGDIGDAYYYMAEYHLSGGDLPLANQQLEMALAAPNLTSVQRQRFKARQDEVREWLREQQRELRGKRNPDGE